MANQIELSKGTEYEFGPQENQVLKGLAGSLMTLVGAWGLLGAAFVAIGIKLATLKGMSGILIAAPLIAGALALLVALFFQQTRAAVLEAVNTEGYDITNVMRAMKRLRTVHTVQGTWFIVQAVLVVIVLLIALLGGK